MARIKLHNPINMLIEAEFIEIEGRGYLGASQLGNECGRYIWYVYHGYKQDSVPQRTMRIWEHGHWEEERVIADLNRIGFTVTRQQEEIDLGYAKGHIDGVIERLPTISEKPHLLEVKSMAEAYWKQVISKGIKLSHFTYYVQANIYAYKLKLPRVLFAFTNKNTEERFFERFHTDIHVAEKYIVRGAEIIMQKNPPKKIGGPDWFQCKFCSFKHTCHEE